jgi:hypothetical protein
VKIEELDIENRYAIIWDCVMGLDMEGVPDVKRESLKDWNN